MKEYKPIIVIKFPYATDEDLSNFRESLKRDEYDTYLFSNLKDELEFDVFYPKENEFDNEKFYEFKKFVEKLVEDIDRNKKQNVEIRELGSTEIEGKVVE